jgi:hypothetical protein
MEVLIIGAVILTVTSNAMRIAVIAQKECSMNRKLKVEIREHQHLRDDSF